MKKPPESEERKEFLASRYDPEALHEGLIEQIYRVAATEYAIAEADALMKEIEEEEKRGESPFDEEHMAQQQEKVFKLIGKTLRRQKIKKCVKKTLPRVGRAFTVRSSSFCFLSACRRPSLLIAVFVPR